LSYQIDVPRETISLNIYWKLKSIHVKVFGRNITLLNLHIFGYSNPLKNLINVATTSKTFRPKGARNLSLNRCEQHVGFKNIINGTNYIKQFLKA